MGGIWTVLRLSEEELIGMLRWASAKEYVAMKFLLINYVLSNCFIIAKEVEDEEPRFSLNLGGLVGPCTELNKLIQTEKTPFSSFHPSSHFTTF